MNTSFLGSLPVPVQIIAFVLILIMIGSIMKRLFLWWVPHYPYIEMEGVRVLKKTINATSPESNEKNDGPIDYHNNYKHKNSKYSVTFEKEDGELVEFKMSQKKYNEVSEGDIGNVLFKGKMYYTFDKDTKESQKTDEI